MSSILTNSSALTALQNLNNTQRSLSKTQSEISTGLKVASAADNSTNWSVSTQMKSDNSVLGTIKASLKDNAAIIKATDAVVQQITTTITDIKTQLAQAADNETGDYAEINKSLAGLANTLTGLMKGASYNGVNLLDGTTATLNVVSGLQDGTGKFLKIDTTLTESNLSTNADIAKLTAPIEINSDTDIETAAKAADDALAAVRGLGAELGAVQNQIDAQTKFIEVLSDSLTNGVSAMVDADMNEASTRLQALQTQQQLGVQSLSIANQNSQMILKLFQ
ncbi:flagellin [Microvirga tunisiensis]|uniref:Flagellin n=1 Tax=Microvirga tunisiensis TaxID=2108360 RepID=A0A5N7MV90_9HYPH|nr:flagellin [Microvirga tunisiensis]MPR12973.1 flagellar hook associated protein [Microvirga tunisiensis]MPR30902.1 flagellar hook associated protein [Microvirga tunisiensis]